MSIWGEETKAAASTPVEIYLRSRGLRLPADIVTIRFHPRLKHRSGSFWPAMVGLVTGPDDKPIGIHRTFLARDGSSKAPVDPNKMMLGPTRGGAVRLAPVAAKLMVAEGIETALTVMQATAWPAWAALSTSGMKALVLPEMVKEVVILADADPPGEAAAQAAGCRWTREGRRVRIARPKGGAKDFNDILLRSIRRTAVSEFGVRP